MNQQYPGDIAPLMRACAELAQRRSDDLARVRASVGKLKRELGHTLARFDHARSASNSQVQAMRAQTTKTLSDGRCARSQQLAGLRARFAQDRALSSARTRQALSSFRIGLQAAVSAIKQQTQLAKRARFQSGSLHPAVLASSKHSRRVPASAPVNPVPVLSKRSAARSFLDL